MTCQKTEPTASQKPFRVLTIDGGGMRGLYSAALLAKLNSIYTSKRFTSPSSEQMLDVGTGFDLIAGTSTGSILGAALASGVPISEVVDLYVRKGPEIFPSPMPSPERKWARSIWAFKNRKHSSGNQLVLKRCLKSIFKEETLKQLFDRRGIGLCITAVRMVDEGSRVFKTPHNPDKVMDNGVKVFEACLASSAAPVFFPLAGLRGGANQEVHFFADGGLWANNPVLIGLIEAVSLAKNGQPIHVISLGTCAQPSGQILSEKSSDRGISDWMFGVKTTSLSMNAQASAFQYMACMIAQILRDKCGTDITVFRIPQTAPSSEHIRLLQMDSPSDESLRLFRSMGEKDASDAHSRTHDTRSEARILAEAFSSMANYNHHSEEAPR